MIRAGRPAHQIKPSTAAHDSCHPGIAMLPRATACDTTGRSLRPVTGWRNPPCIRPVRGESAARHLAACTRWPHGDADTAVPTEQVRRCGNHAAQCACGCL